MKKVAVSILIPAKNEAANLPRCLAAVRWADEIWVVDSQSTDGSQAIVEAEDRRRRTEDGAEKAESGDLKRDGAGSEKGTGTGRVRMVQFEFNGTWPKKKNWALANLPFKHEWVFVLDADEVLPPGAEAEIRAIVGDASRLAEEGGLLPDQAPRTAEPLTNNLSPPNNTGEDIAGYWINRRFMFMGRWLKHAYYPNWNLRLFRHRLGRYEKLTDSATDSGDNEVHEHVVVQGRTGRLQEQMDHYAFPDIATFVEKHNRYSNWEARVALDRYLGRSASELQSRDVGWRRRLKAWSQHLPGRPVLRFIYVYFLQLGFLDGVEGYYFARLHAMYEFLCVAKGAEIRRRNRAGRP